MLLEREPQLSELVSLVNRLDGSGGSVVLIRGEAGIGKSSLVFEFMARLEEGVHILFGACDDLLTPQTLGAFWDVARDEPAIAELLRDDDRRQIQEALLDLLFRSLRPTILIIEDTQWADEATLDVIKFLGRRIAATNGLMVLTYRDTEIDSDHALRQVIGDLPPTSVVRVQLEPLSADAVAVMISDDALDVASVLAQTDGNPLYVAELMTWGSDDVPSSIQEMVVARAGRTSDEAKQLLEVVSVIPGEADRGVVAVLVGDDLAGLPECERTGLLRSTDTAISFVHELQRRAIEAALRPERRRDLNEHVLRSLRQDADASRLVHHARAAGDVQALIEYAPIAARAAVSAGSTREAVAHFRLLEPHLEDIATEMAADILLEWARQEFQLHGSSAEDLIDRAITAYRTIGNELELGRALAFSARIKMRLFRTEPALEHAQEAVAILESHRDTPALADALGTLAHVTWLYHEDVPASLAIAERALAVAEASGDDIALIQALSAKGNIQHSVGETGGMALLEMSRSLAADAGDRRAEVQALSNMTAMAADFRQMPQAMDLARRTIETAARYEMRYIETEARAMYAEILLWIGRWDEVENMAIDALGSHPSAETIAWRILGTLRARRGRSDARATLERMWKNAETSNQLTVIDPAAGVLAEFMWLTDDLDAEWVERLDEVLAEGIKIGNPWPSGAFALWMWKLGRLNSTPGGTLDMYGWIIDGDLDLALAFWRARDLPYEQAITLMHGSSKQQLEALRIAEDLGADALAARIRRELVVAGHTPPRGRSRVTREHAAGLTARQAEVLEELAEGLSNTEIADRLFLSPRTVENHVAAILLKLDVPSREAAVVAARDQGIL